MILASSYPVTGNGLGGLPDAIEATVTHEINGQYELYMRYPVTGLHYDELLSGRIIMAEPDDLTDAQPFRIYRITKPLNGIVSVYARHLCYDMQGIIVEPFTVDSLTNAFLTIPTKCTPASPITLQTTRTVASGMSISEPRPLWKLIGGQSGSILDVYGGEWDFDKDVAKLVTQLGADRGVSIRYGKNMTEMEQDATIESSYSGVYPYWYDEESNTLVTLTEKYVTVVGAVVSDRVLMLDCSDDFDTQPSEQDLRDRANAYILANSVGNVKASWKISFVDTQDLPFDKIMLGDTLHVYYERLDVNATARAVKTEYDVLSGRYKAITVGRVKQNLASIIVDNQEKTESEFAQVKSDLETAVDDATDFIRNGQGYMRFIYNSSNELVEIVSLDDPDITQALSVWRWNNGGFGHSSTGYNGNYTLAITQNGAIVADFITAGTLTANVIRAGILQDTQGYNSWNLQTGAFSITNGSINITTSNLTFDAITLKYGDNETYQSPYEHRAVDRSTQDAARVTSSGIFLYDNFFTPSPVLRTQIQQDYYVLYDILGKMRLQANTAGIYQYDSSANKRTELTENGLNFYNSSGTLTASYESSALRIYDSGTARTQIRNSAGCSWHQGRYYSSLQNKWCNNTSAFFPALSAKAYSSDWSLGCLNNDFYLVNTKDSNYNSNTNSAYKYRFPYVDASTTVDVLSTGNTADRVIAQGTASSWNYRKWASGVYECWRRFEISMAINSSWSTWYYGEVPRQSYPVTFTAAPREYCQYTGGSGWAVLGGATSLQSTTQTAQYYLFRPTSTGTGTYYFEFYVRGTV